MNSQNRWIPTGWQDLMIECTNVQDYLLHCVLDLKYDLERRTGHTVIRSVSSRLKTYDSLRRKLERLEQPVTPESAASALHDIVGIRIICSYLGDVRKVLGELSHLGGFTITEIKDYISRPKPSGYRSLHVIGVCGAGGHPVACEFQLRTTAMDSWAALEHQMRYKKDFPQSDFVNAELYDCSCLLFENDLRMERIFHYIQNQEDTGQKPGD